MINDPHFINLVNRIIRDCGSRAGMDGVSQRSVVLLRLIGEVEALDQPMRVTELVKQSGSGTAPTIYSSVAELEDGGWIDRHADEKDGRATRLHLTAKSRRVFAEMSRQIERMAKA
jgi:DNA-binding MarR family transcriptional regulator